MPVYGIEAVKGGCVISRRQFSKSEYCGSDGCWVGNAKYATPFESAKDARAYQALVEDQDTLKRE